MPQRQRPAHPLDRPTGDVSGDRPTEAPPLDVWLTVGDEAWRTDARCRDLVGTMTEVFFSDDLVDIARAKAMCARCAVRPECLEAALARREPWGVWGGELLERGRIVEHKRPRGRPPKTPRPPLVVDEVPPPLPLTRPA